MEFRDLKAQYHKYENQIRQAIEGVLEKAHFIGGEKVTALEKQLAEYVGTKHCITCANGTEAMTLVLMAWGIGEGDAVFVPDFTFFSTGEVVSFVGATPIFVDVDEKTFNMDPKKLEEAILRVKDEGRFLPKAVIPVDLFGLPADYNELLPLAERHGLLVLEDGAQGFGGSIGNQRACSFGHAATTSFFPAKPLGCYGDGGAIFLNDDSQNQHIRSLKVHGKGNDKYDNVRIGVNSRLDTLQAAVLQVKLTAFIDHELEDVNQAANWYRKAFMDLKDQLDLPVIPEGFISSYAQFTIQLKSKEERDGLQQYLKEQGIPSMVYYNKPMHCQGAFAHLDMDETCYPVTNRLCDTVLSLPMHPYLTQEDVETVASHIKKYLRR